MASTNTLNIIVLLRRGTTAEWAASTKVLWRGEAGVDTTLRILKVGNGVDLWAALPITAGGVNLEALAACSGTDKLPYLNSAGLFALADLTSYGRELINDTSYAAMRTTIGAMANPMNAAGQIIIGGSSGTPTALPVGDAGEVLTLVGGVPSWEAASGGMDNPMTAAGDIIIAEGLYADPAALPIGEEDDVLTVVDGAPAWAPPATGGMANPMNAPGDIIFGTGLYGTPDNLAIGDENDVLTVKSGAPSWDPVAVDHSAVSGLGDLATQNNPMTASGDIIVGGASGALSHLAKDADGMVLKLASGTPTWSSVESLEGVGSMAFVDNPMTDDGDMIVGEGLYGEPGRLPAGDEGQVLAIDSGTPTWVDAADVAGIGTMAAEDAADYALLAGRTGGQTLRGGPVNDSGTLGLTGTAVVVTGCATIKLGNPIESGTLPVLTVQDGASPAVTEVPTHIQDYDALAGNSNSFSAATGDTIVAVWAARGAAGAVPHIDSMTWGGESFTDTGQTLNTDQSVRMGIRTRTVSSGGNYPLLTTLHPAGALSSASISIIKILASSSFYNAAGATGTSTSPASGNASIPGGQTGLAIHASCCMGAPTTPGSRIDGGTDFCAGFGDASYIRGAYTYITSGGSFDSHISGMSNVEWIAVCGVLTMAAASRTGPLQSWKDAAGAELASITHAGVFTGSGSGLTGVPVAAHDILSAGHSDSTAAAVVRGDVVTAQGATPKWARLAKGSAGTVLTMGADEPAWAAPKVRYVWTANGPYTVDTAVDGGFVAPVSFNITSVKLWRGVAGASGSTTIDLNKDTGTGPVTMYTTQGSRPSIGYAQAVPHVVTASLPDITAVAAGNVLTIDTDAIEGGTPQHYTLEIEGA